MLSERTANKIGWFASLTAIMMFGSYVDQIRLNLAGVHGSILLPLATMANCAAWITYSQVKAKKDWPIFACNALGLVLAAGTVGSALI